MTDNSFGRKLAAITPLSATDIRAVEAVTAVARKYKPRQDLIREGDQPGPVFVILEGWACRYKFLPDGRRQVLAFLMPGDCCDLHVNMLAEMDHGIQAVSAVRVASVKRPDLDRLMTSFPAVGQAMYMAQLIDEGVMRAWIVSMGRRTTLERVAHLMCELYLRMHNVGLSEGHSFSLPLSQIILADALGMSTVHINRVFRHLRLAGAMVLRREGVEITNLAKLIRIAGFDANYLHRRMPQPISAAITG